jgi:ABC-2 type transport system permease protein
MTAVATLARTEFRLLSREWPAMVFAFVFPPITLLIIGGAFGDQPDEGFGGVVPEDFYVTGYLGVPLAALTLIGLPVVLASYRERDVLRRFAAFGVSTTTVVTAQALVTALLVAVAAVTVLAVAVPTYGIPTPDQPLQVGAAFLAGTATMILLGTGLGLSVRTARGAQAIGLLAFFPMFLLSGGGPPPDVMSEPMRRIADVLPLTHVIGGIREPWLGTGNVAGHLLVLAAWGALGLALVAWRVRHDSWDSKGY